MKITKRRNGATGSCQPWRPKNRGAWCWRWPGRDARCYRCWLKWEKMTGGGWWTDIIETGRWEWRGAAEGRESWCWSVLDWKCREDQRGEEKKQGRAMKEKLKEEEREEIGKEEMIVLEWRWLLLMYMVRKFSCPKSFFFF